ncbi:RNA pseudouridylate synthase domain-containing protein 2 [Drosophila willistoni]|uniref:RNA pseudouridylate synthase domain-containing protein 2 n=1 Tax=Drosophila willistoni TaxID=7260 RepID=UPI001F075826|nr:RNA pseudouridylate synthase domain-containing protein 2 [Drosophila willistoni]
MDQQQSKLLRHAQTQHGDNSTDIDNIFVNRATNVNKNIQPPDAPSPECVWFHQIDNENGNSPEVTEEEQKTEKQSQLSTCTTTNEGQAAEKRKATTFDEISEAKKIKYESKHPKATRPGFNEDRFEETSYYIENGLRKVYPYFFTFTTFTKGRWVGDKILDVFSREFRAHPAEVYQRSIEAGKLTVNHEIVPADYSLKHNDLLANVVHRHEVPVTAQPIRIIHMDEDIVVVNKPASIPVHPCGRYRHNTVVFILAKEFNLKDLRTIHRLDRLTSGLLLFGRNANKARELEQQIRQRQVQKEYVCLVEGKFPDGIIECNESIEVVSYKIGVCRVSPKGKDCKTTFQRLSNVGDSSLVLCKPLTGRMHQIRVHLQYLGYPIVNDPLYNHEVFGPLKGRGGDFGGRSDEQLISDLISIHNAENWLGIDGDIDTVPLQPISVKDNAIKNGISLNSAPAVNLPEQSVATQTGHDEPDCTFDVSKVTTDPDCHECKLNLRDPVEKDLIMYLHAWKYKGIGWEYETELPAWALKDSASEKLT